MKHRKHNHKKQAIAKAEYVKALYNRDKVCGTLLPIGEYFDMFTMHTKNEFLKEYLTTDKSAEWLLDTIREHKINTAQERIKAENIKNFKDAIKKIEPNSIEELTITAETVPDRSYDGTISLEHTHKEVFVKIVYKSRKTKQ